LVLVNAAAGIYITGVAASLSKAYNSARESIRSGMANQKLQQLGAATNQ